MEPGKINENRFQLSPLNSQLISWQSDKVISTVPRISDPVNVNLAWHTSIDRMVIHAWWIVKPFRMSGDRHVSKTVRCTSILSFVTTLRHIWFVNAPPNTSVSSLMPSSECYQRDVPESPDKGDKWPVMSLDSRSQMTSWVLGVDVILGTRRPTMKLERILTTVRGGDPIVDFPKKIWDSIEENDNLARRRYFVNMFAFLMRLEFGIPIYIRSYCRWATSDQKSLLKHWEFRKGSRNITKQFCQPFTR